MMMDSSRAKKVILPYDVGFWHIAGIDIGWVRFQRQNTN